MLYKRPAQPIKKDIESEEGERNTINSAKEKEGEFVRSSKDQKEELPNPYKPNVKHSNFRNTGPTGSTSRPYRANPSTEAPKSLLHVKPRTVSSFKKGVSNVYNITFQE